MVKRLGSEISLFTDKYGPPRRWQDNWLAFSNGRAALAWLFDIWHIKDALVCAYTCPNLISFMRRRGIGLKFFDVGQEIRGSADVTILPALFGSNPLMMWTASDHERLVIIDAAQTAFGHEYGWRPSRGVVLSCPRKCTSLADGAVLEVSLNDQCQREQREIAALPIATESSSAKMAARGMWDTDAPEQWALWWNVRAEALWPETPHRMSDESKALLMCLDKGWHQKTRQLNADRLASWTASVPGKLLFWKLRAIAPYCFPIFVGNQQELLAYLHARRIFATALWPDAERDPKQHPNADWMARHLVSLPVDQRHDAEDMERIAKAVLAVAKPPSHVPEGMRRFVA